MGKKKTTPQEIEEKIDAMGQESEIKAARWVKEEYKRAEEDQKEEEEKKLETLSKKRKRPKIFSYKEELAISLADLVKEEGFPKEYGWRVRITDKGIQLDIFKRDGSFRKMRRFAISGDAKYDLQATEQFAYWAGDMVLADTQKEEEIIVGQ